MAKVADIFLLPRVIYAYKLFLRLRIMGDHPCAITSAAAHCGIQKKGETMSYTCSHCFSNSVNDHGICAFCGFDNIKNRRDFPAALPPGSILYGRYIIGRVLGQGGYGITYLAQDHRANMLVAIKEFFPDSIATRTNSTCVIPFSGSRGENFQYGKDAFLEEAKTMAAFNQNPHIAGVKMYFEENGTAYFVMEYVDGISLKQYIQTRGGRLSWQETAEIILPVLNALEAVHQKGIIHRDVAPDNIYITADRKIKLLDFGAARYSLGNVSQSLDVILKHGFAPIEQYSRHSRQGPYTDVYAVTATIYYALTGYKPKDAVERSSKDATPTPTALGVQINPGLEGVLMKGLAVNASNRYQSAAELSKALLAFVEKSIPKSPEVDTAQKKSSPIWDKWFLQPKWLLIIMGSVIILLLIALVAVLITA